MTTTDDTHDTAAGTGDEPPVIPGHRIPMSSGGWRYSLGDDGLTRGVYTQTKSGWQWVAPLPHVTARLSDRDGDGRRDGIRYRLVMDLDAASKQAAVCDTRDVMQGEWAPKLDVSLSADRKVRDAAATAIFEAAHTPGVVQGETVPTWQNRDLVMPPPDLCPDGYMDYAADEDRAREAWRELGEIIAESPRLGLFAGGALAGLYVGPLSRQPFILEAAGGGRTGKSTAVVLGGSVLGWAGIPEQPEGTVRSANASAQGMQQALRGLSVLPAFADETGSAKRTAAQREEFIFTISQGASRTVGTRSGTGYRTAGWSGIYLATGNESVAEGIRNEGVWARVVSSPTPVTVSHEAAERVAQLIPVAYGWPLQWLMRRGMDVDSMAARFVAAGQDLQLSHGGVAGTLAQHLALLVAGARLLGDLVGVQFGDAVVDEARRLADILVTRLNEQGATPGDRLVSAVMAARASHPRTFPPLNSYRAHLSGTPLPGEEYPPHMPPVVDGFIPAPGQLAVLWDRLPVLAREAEINDAGPGLDQLNAAGRLITDKGRRQKAYKIDGVNVRTFTFVLPDEDDEDEATTADEGRGPESTRPGGSGTSPDPRDEAPRVATEPRVATGTPQVATGVTTGTPESGNPTDNPVTSENTPPEGGELPKLPLTNDDAVYRGTGNRPTGNRPPADQVVAVTADGETLYLGTPTPEGPDIRTAPAGTLVADLGRLLDYVADLMPHGGTLALDEDAADALGWPYDPETRDQANGQDRPRAYRDATAAGWSTRSPVGGWTTWERGARWTYKTHVQQGQRLDHVAITTAVLPWMHSGFLGTSTNRLFEHEDDPYTACHMLVRMHELVGAPFAYGAGSTLCMTMRAKWYERTGRPRRLPRNSRRPRMVVSQPRDEDGNPSGPVYPGTSLPDTALSWAAPGALEAEDGNERFVVSYDAVAQHVGTITGQRFAIDAPTPVETAEWDPAVPGLWWLEGSYTLACGLPIATPGAGGGWVHTELVRLLIEQDQVPDVFSAPAWVPVDRDGTVTRGSQIFKALGTKITGGLKSIPRGTDDPLEGRVRDTLKSVYAESSGELTRHPFVRRPDWSMSILAGSKAQTIRRAIRVHEETGLWPIHVKVDCLTYETEGPDPEEHNPAPEILRLDPEKTNPGMVKTDFAGTLAEFAKKQKGK